jgi:hypothetical protein
MAKGMSSISLQRDEEVAHTEKVGIIKECANRLQSLALI